MRYALWLLATLPVLASAADSETFSVLIQFKQPSPIFQRAEGPNWRMHTQMFFQQQNRANIQTLKSMHPELNTMQDLWIAGAASARLTEAQIREIAKLDNVQSVSLSGTAHLVDLGRAQFVPRLADSDYTYGLQKIRVPEVRAQGRDGRGVVVGILDTGIDAGHAALQGKVMAFRDFIGKGKSPYDDHGHGTHVAGTIAGSELNGLSFGVAPGAKLVIGKVFSQYGRSEDSILLAGMQWMTDPDGNPATDDAPYLVSNSWTSDSEFRNDTPENQVFCKAVNTWVRLGIIPVFAVGNEGPNANTVGVPAGCPGALGVAATDSDDVIADFSSRGPVIWSNGNVDKPDIAAPGVDIESAQNGGGTTSMSGTSMATPHVAGSLALLLQGASRTNVAAARQALIEGAVDLSKSKYDYAYGHGRIDLVSSLAIMSKAVQKR